MPRICCRATSVLVGVALLMPRLRNAVLKVFVRRDDAKVEVLSCLLEHEAIAVIADIFGAAGVTRRNKGRCRAYREERMANMMALRED